MKARLLAAVAALLFVSTPFARAADPIARWSFGTEEASRLLSAGGVHRDQPGPRPPEYPDFEKNNLAVQFDGGGAHFSFADAPGAENQFDFTNGDAITLEAWVNMADINKGENTYIIGKGRTGDPKFAKDNQNWALRIRETGGLARISFLFATTPAKGGAKSKDEHWHRWVSNAGFKAGSGWHHVAVTYRFGEPESIRGYLDGKRTDGEWDMGGATKLPPVVDNDAIWIGSAMGGSAASSFRGMLDEIAVYREIIPEDVMRTRYRREGVAAIGPTTAPAEIVPAMKEMPSDRFLITLHDGLAAHNRWPTVADGIPKETTRWTTNDLFLTRLPLKYDDIGIRESWQGPVLLRAGAQMTLPPGTQKFMFRALGMGRLMINGQTIAKTKVLTGSTDGHNPVPPLPEPPLPGHRPAGYDVQEVYGTAQIPADGRAEILLEVIVGGKSFRAAPAEVLVAMLSPDGKSYLSLHPGQGEATPLTEAGWQSLQTRSEAELATLDDTTRRQRAASVDAFWQKRHEIAKQWASANPAPAVPAGAANPIDAFIKARIEKAKADSATATTAEAKQFHEKVFPALSENCFRCHGEKEKGDLRLNSRAAALKPGSSGHAAVVPGDLAKSELISRIRSKDPEERMPPKGDGLKPDEIAAIEQWIKAGAPWPAAPVSAEQVAMPPVVSDEAYLRRAYLDTVGVPPTEAEARKFLDDKSADKRAKLIDRLLADERLADHWVSYWQDVLAENPSMLKPSLNNSGPFRYFLHDAIRDGKPLDRMVTELVLMRGSKYEGGSAGFSVAADNDAPYAAKAQIIGGAFLGMELQCARCHDAPFHSYKQKELYSMAAMLERKTVTVPKTSTVPAAFFEKKARESLIKVTMKPGEPIPPAWALERVCGVKDDASIDQLVQSPKDSRERLAALLTAPQNERFAQVMVNRVFRRLIGAGLIEPAHDWEGHAASHPEMLAWLGRELVASGYDLRHVIRLVMTSNLYQRESIGNNRKAPPEQRFFTAPDRRRLTAEQVVDSLYSGAGKQMQTEELNFDPDARRPASSFISLGEPRRSWMLCSLSNERDRPSLALPRAQAVSDALEAFGWTGSRQNPRTDRETDPNVLQPGVLANSTLSTWVTRVSPDGALAKLALEAKSPEDVVDSVFIRFLTRKPTTAEKAPFAQALSAGFANRVLPAEQVKPIPDLPRIARISWSTHLVGEANSIKLEMERRARAGDPADPRLNADWRERYEDFIWAVINSPEFVWMP